MYSPDTDVCFLFCEALTLRLVCMLPQKEPDQGGKDHEVGIEEQPKGVPNSVGIGITPHQRTGKGEN